MFLRERSAIAKLAHEGGHRFGGEFIKAKLLYHELLSAEGHRNYPLREAKVLRSSLDLALPFNPFLFDWGVLVAAHPKLSRKEDLASVVTQLLRGCGSKNKAWCIPGQVGYYRALAGINSVVSIESTLSAYLDTDSLSVFRNHVTRQHLSLSQEHFEGKLRDRVLKLLSY